MLCSHLYHHWVIERERHVSLLVASDATAIGYPSSLTTTVALAERPNTSGL